MLKHIVVWKFKDHAENADKTENLLKVKGMLESLKGKIPQIRVFEVAPGNPGGDLALDLMLYSEFEDRDALLAYQKHPEHVRVAEFIGKVQMSRAVFDYDSRGTRG